MGESLGDSLPSLMMADSRTDQDLRNGALAMDARTQLVADIIDAGGFADSRDYDLEAIADEVLEPYYPGTLPDTDEFWHSVREHAITWDVELTYKDTPERDRLEHVALTRDGRQVWGQYWDRTFNDDDGYDELIAHVSDLSGLPLDNLHELTDWNEATLTECVQVSIDWKKLS